MSFMLQVTMAIGAPLGRDLLVRVASQCPLYLMTPDSPRDLIKLEMGRDLVRLAAAAVKGKFVIVFRKPNVTAVEVERALRQALLHG
jgi:hypothetical protein